MRIVHFGHTFLFSCYFVDFQVIVGFVAGKTLHFLYTDLTGFGDGRWKMNGWWANMWRFEDVLER